ncbi:MAG: YbaN family protein [Pseudomonadales bacterium]|nr:YbaN family protein [Pseudomonadales bacterium]
MIRILLIVAGTLCVGLGVLGIFLPLLPTTPFLLLAAACYVRSSDRLYQKLINHRVFGPLILNWREHRSIPRQSKLVAMGLIVVTFSISIFVVMPHLYGKLALGGMGIFGLFCLSRVPTTEAVLARKQTEAEAGFSGES